MIANIRRSLKIKHSLILQRDQLDCGPAALLSIVKFYCGASTIEQIRQMSGTGLNGTTLLGLFKTAKNLGFNAEGCTIDMGYLLNQDAPCILHVNLPVGHHFLVFFGIKKVGDSVIFILGDPAIGVRKMTATELSEIWVSKVCLLLEPGDGFQTSKENWRLKRNWLITLLQSDKDLIAISISLGVAVAILGLVMSIFSQKLIDEILPDRDMKRLFWGVTLVFILLMARESLSALRQFFLIRQSKDFSIRVINFFYSHIVSIRTSFFYTRKIGDLTARLNDTSRIQKVLSQIISNIVNDFLIAVVAIAFIFYKSWQIGLLALTILPIYYLLIYLNNSKIISAQKKLMASYAATESNYISTLQGINVIKNFNKQQLYSKINKSIYQSYQNNQFSLGQIQIRLGFFANILGTFFIIGVLSVACLQVFNKQIQIGELVAILGMSATLLPSVASLALLAIPVNEAKVAIDRMFEFTSIQPESLFEQSEVKEIKQLKVEHLKFNYPFYPPVLEDISFQVEKGDFIAIMGENGCGKSTLIQVLQRDYAPLGGNIIINGNTNLSDIDISCIRKLFAVVPQAIHLFNGTILENIAFDDVANDPNRLFDFINETGIASYFEKNGISHNTLIGEEGINLSGGQRQLIAIARALYHKPNILILDEATAAMDRETEFFVLNLLVKFKKEGIIIFITHRLHVLRKYCDRIYLIENGVVSTYGTHEQLIATQNMYSNYWSDYIS